MIRIGTSGWSYPHWKGRFYPEKLPARLWFSHYVRHFDTVEINNTFYRLPEEKTFARWRDSSPERFVFALKLSRFITHVKRLVDVRAPLERFLERSGRLGKNLGPLLVQLPPGLQRDTGRLRAFLELFPVGVAVVLEFRNSSWFHPEIYELMEDFGVGFCRHDMQGIQCPSVATGRLRYFRFHGTGEKYAGRYSSRQLRRWADEIRGDAQAAETYVYFNNDEMAHAVVNALELKSILGLA